ncbi:MAG: alkaline phosphatase D family protein [Phycisphaerae bacterium]|nr:alkaline phosphatase D family protein [Phycisphaerae bacterium]
MRTFWCALALTSITLPPPAKAGFPNGVAAGDVDHQSAVLWARSDAPGLVTFELATDPSFAQIVATASQQVVDVTVPAKVALTGLSDGVRYFYRATDAAAAVATGTFVTPALTGYRGLRMGVSGDWRGELNPYPSISNAPARQLDLWVSHGDTIYADVASPAVPLPQATTIAEHRAKHAEVYAERFGTNSFAPLRASTAFLVNIDDHEVTNDFQGGAPPSSDPRFAGESVAFINETMLYQTGLQAFREYNPTADVNWAGTGDPRFDGKPDLYRARRYGLDAAVFVVDARSFRDQGLPPVTNPNDLTQIVNFVLQSFTPGRTMLGTAQRERLKSDLLAAEQRGVTWKFVLIPEPTQNLGVLAASDRFEGYAWERTNLLSFIAANGISNVVFVAADIHGTLVNEIAYQTAPGEPQVPTGAFEITTGSVAYAAPFGPTVVGLAAQFGLISPAEFALYNSLPRAGRDDFLVQLINTQLDVFKYPALGLGGGDVAAALLAGTYWPTHTYGWTEFEIEPETQLLTVTTYGIDWYSATELLANPAAILARTPSVVSRFSVSPVGKAIAGDLNCDGFVTVADISGFIQALIDPAAYDAANPFCDRERADVSGDGFVTVGDIGGFVTLLTAAR